MLAYEIGLAEYTDRKLLLASAISGVYRGPEHVQTVVALA